jgi:hypothetical protein
MTTQEIRRPQVPEGIISDEEAKELIFDALQAEPDEPELLVKLLVILHDNSESYLQEAMWRLIRAAYNHSMYQSFSIRDYMAVIREGRDPLTEAREKWKKEEAKEGATRRPKKEGSKAKRRKRH